MMIQIGIRLKRRIISTIKLLTGGIQTEDGFSILMEDGTSIIGTEED